MEAEEEAEANPRRHRDQEEGTKVAGSSSQDLEMERNVESATVLGTRQKTAEVGDTRPCPVYTFPLSM